MVAIGPGAKVATGKRHGWNQIFLDASTLKVQVVASELTH
jgi:hypothetical protein